MNTDMGGVYRFDTSVNKWVPLTDWITNNDPQWGIKYNGAETVAVDPTDAGRVYAGLGTYMGGNGAILRSSDQGRTWLRTNVPFGMDGNGSGRNSGQRMMVDPNSPNILFYATRNSGIWKSSSTESAGDHTRSRTRNEPWRAWTGVVVFPSLTERSSHHPGTRRYNGKRTGLSAEMRSRTLPSKG